ncbi:hypothetical protein LV84_03435 [Algoriphagus ratkowskyi]|uniref:Uncharacterized protein n=1 Tax=Algoriphagus ratkowskyi TaxID=57028 RepID=A0A2W7RE07_9BACT|nr:hypothetical protein [Algoriphagus ratkowskyi]PZX52429.1 hypothetical protein LV84_03435 [Algoriphagus ratkowskyi]TXD76222.1 hypothetical protein ESW18_17485 [Algoriphagus ratkowskyi]
MQKIPKIQDFRAPENYFDNLPDDIIKKVKPQTSIHWMKYAAIALLVLSFGVWQFTSSESQVETLSMDDEIAFYIESQYWTAEDVLSMVDNPEEILDQIIFEEMMYEVEVVNEYDKNWY